MRAMVITAFGGPDVFEQRDVPKPGPGPLQVLVRVHATSINPVDYKIRQSGSWAGVQPPAIIGYDVSGVVEAVGAGVRDFQPGDQVFYTPELFSGQGSYAEYHVADERIVARKPANLTHVEAASLPLSGGTAWDAIVTRAQLKPAETVLVHGSGSVGLAAIQIARAAGARVIATAGRNSADFARDLGAHVVVDAREEDFVEVVERETRGAGVDVVFDTVGGSLLMESVEITRPHGRLVGIVAVTGDLSPAIRRNLTIHFLFLERARYKLDAIRTLVERGQFKPAIDSVLPLDQVAEAHRRIQRGGLRGKIVLEVAQG